MFKVAALALFSCFGEVSAFLPTSTLPSNLSVIGENGYNIHKRSNYSYLQKSKTPLVVSNTKSRESDDLHAITWVDKIESLISENPNRSILFSLEQIIAGALLGPLLDSYHSSFGVLQYDQPFTRQLWSSNVDHPALITTWWVPPLFGLAGFIIGWLYIILDELFLGQEEEPLRTPVKVTAPLILVGISYFTFQYWLSGILFASGVDRTIILAIMSICAVAGFQALDRTISGFITSIATAVGGPLIEVGLITTLSGTSGGYHYLDPGETGFFPLWIIPVYFLGGPANGNLARGVWNSLGSTAEEKASTKEPAGCEVCNDSRVVPCPNCDGMGYYMSYGSSVTCTCCKGRGVVICRSCFDHYGEDPYDIEKIRDFMSNF
jgi:hypothetical protein